MLEVRSLSKSYRNVAAVRDVSFSVSPGELVGLIGPNGAGKSTTLRVIGGLERPDSGDALVAGHSVLTSPLEAKRALGYVPQDAALYPFLTGEEHLLFVARVRGLDEGEARARADRLLKLFELDGARDRLCREYSEGMSQKLAIAAAVIGRPRVLVLDESLNGLDPQSTARARRLLEELIAEGTAVLLTSHILDMMERICTRVVMLHGGAVVRSIPREELAALRAAGTSLEDEYLRTVTA